jgi:hypothetical protein
VEIRALAAQEPINIEGYIKGDVTLDELVNQFSDRINKLILENRSQLEI